jgi:hypothetical protein
MTVHFTAIARQAAEDGVITPEEILSLRREGWGDGQITHAEAEAIFVLDAALTERPADWCDFLVEAIGEYVLNTWEPRGYVSDEQGAWLVAKVSADGRLDSMTELELLVRVLERAHNAPDTLKRFVLAQVERAVMSGVGPTRDGGSLGAGVINETDCKILRRAMFAAGGDRPAAVSRDEAEMLFRLKDATRGADNAPGWKQLFVQGVGNYLQGYGSLSAQLTRERAAELDAFMSDGESNVGRFLGRMAKSVPAGTFLRWSPKVSAPSRGDSVAAAEAVTPEEKTWLDQAIGADDQVDELEQALLAFLAEETARA